MPLTEWKPTTVTELSRLLAENAEGPKRTVIPVGGRTGLRIGGTHPGNAIPVVLSELSSVVDYPTGDLTITVEAGMRIEDLQAHLKAVNQCLPIDIPLSQRATVGGAIASDASGPGRYKHGTFRDYVIGITAVDGVGRIFSAGGRVVKNVAGYDLCKLLTGSLGTLGIITQVTLKLKPVSAKTALVLLPVANLEILDEILTGLNTSATRPVALDVLNPRAGRQIQSESRRRLAEGNYYLLCVGYEGGVQEVDWQVATLSEELRRWSQESTEVLTGEAGDVFWNALTNFQVASDDPLTVQVSVLPSRVTEVLQAFSDAGISCQAHAGNGIVIGHLPDSCSDAAQACSVLTQLKQVVEGSGGSLRIINCEPDFSNSLGKCVSALPEQKLHERLKQALDPLNLLSPGRLALSAT